MPAMLAVAADVILPGAGLAAQGRLAAGLPLLGVAALALVAGLLAGEVLEPGPAAALHLAALAAWAGCALGAALLRWRRARRQAIDPQLVRRLHRAACAAWLRGEPGALDQARALTAAAPEEAGAWAFLARVAADAGDLRLARRAGARAEALG